MVFYTEVDAYVNNNSILKEKSEVVLSGVGKIHQTSEK